MAFVERRAIYRPKSGAAPFKLEEIFFSRTNNRGIILAGNEIFRRVSHFEWQELIGAPHKIIRHEDMPKGVFQLLWDTIKDDRPIAAYVKNKAKDGLYYWVIAIVIPTEGGYLSVRIKPSSEIFDVVQDLYKSLIIEETNTKITPEESAQLLIEKIKDLGFSDYSNFATHALSEELVVRDKALNASADKNIESYKEMIVSVDGLQLETDKLTSEFEALNSISTNMRIIASRLEPSGGPISALSENYWSLAQEISDWFRGFVSESGNAFGTINHTINDGMFLSCTARVLVEAVHQFRNEKRAVEGISVKTELQSLDGLVVRYSKSSIKGLHAISEEAHRISSAVPIMRRYITGLSATRIMCKIESARLTGDGESLSGIIEQLGSFQQTIEVQLDEIDGWISRINALVARVE